MTYSTQRLTPDSEALDYNKLEQPWRDWAKIARNFAYQVKEQDREDLMHDIIVRLAEVAELYRQQGKPLTKWGSIRVARYTRLRFYHQKKRWGKVASISLNSPVRDDDGNETELINTLASPKGVGLDTWIDAKNFYQSRPKKERKAIRKLIDNGDGDGHRLSGYDWKLIREFRAEFKALA